MATEELGDAYKFDEGFYDKIAATPPSLAVSGSDDTPTVYYPVVLITNDKDDLVNDLEDDYDVQNVFNPEYLDNVITADVHADQILKLASNPIVYKIRDGDLALESESSSSSKDSGLSTLANKRSHGWNDKITQTGRGIVIGTIDVFNSLYHNDLPASVVTARYHCTTASCTTPLSTVYSYLPRMR